MIRSPLTSVKAEEIVREHGVRWTAPRRAVWALFHTSPRGLSIAEAVDALAADGIGLATVYRTVELFERIRLLRRIHSNRGDHLYVAASPGHTHALVCRSCGHTVEFDACRLGRLESDLAAATGFDISGHELEVYGTCPDCR